VGGGSRLIRSCDLRAGAEAPDPRVPGRRVRHGSICVQARKHRGGFVAGTSAGSPPPLAVWARKASDPKDQSACRRGSTEAVLWQVPAQESPPSSPRVGEEGICPVVSICVQARRYRGGCVAGTSAGIPPSSPRVGEEGGQGEGEGARRAPRYGRGTATTVGMEPDRLEVCIFCTNQNTCNCINYPV
jgi:hypothetical protein